jgi:hypothetical protein
MNARVLLAVVLCTIATAATAGPKWASQSVKTVRILDGKHELVRAITDRAELEAFGAWFERAPQVEGTTEVGHWTHFLDIGAPEGRRWVYDAATGDFMPLSMKRGPVYRLQPEDQARLAALLSAGSAPPADPR